MREPIFYFLAGVVAIVAAPVLGLVTARRAWNRDCAATLPLMLELRRVHAKAEGLNTFVVLGLAASALLGISALLGGHRFCAVLDFGAALPIVIAGVVNRSPTRSLRCVIEGRRLWSERQALTLGDPLAVLVDAVVTSTETAADTAAKYGLPADVVRELWRRAYIAGLRDTVDGAV